MNIFEAIYLRNDDQVERDIIALETVMDIEVARANREYALESALIELGDNTLFMEAPENKSSVKVKHENAFIKTVKTICNAIRNFISDIISTIAGLFDNRENVNIDDYMSSNTGKVRLEKDVRQIENIVNEELRQGNKLIQMLSKVSGISDEEIEKWIKSGTEKLAKVAPVIIPVALGFGFKKLFSSAFKSGSSEVSDAEKAATSGDASDPDKNRKITKILNHMHSLVKTLGTAAKEWSSVMRKAMKKAK